MMKNTIWACLAVILIASCSSGPSANEMMVSGNVKGLKKGVLYLQQIQDTTLTTLDSLVIEGNGQFSFTVPVESPEVFYLYLKKEDHNEVNDRIMFFGEPGTVTIETKWNTFDINPTINGSATHEKFAEYQDVLSKFNKKDLELFRAKMNPEILRDSVLVDSMDALLNRNALRSVLYSLNFALNNKDSYIAPYVALYEVPDAKKIYLDSIYNNLSDEVAASKYGKGLKKLLESKTE